MRGKKSEEHHNIADGSGTPSASAVVEAARERERKKVLEERIGKQPQLPKAFFCDQCKLFYFEVEPLTGIERKGKCPMHDKPKKGKKR